MKALLSTLALAAAVSVQDMPAAVAYDYNDVGYGHIERDRAKIQADARKVREEETELNQARRQLRWSWWSGDYWGAHRASEKVREEQRELGAARHRLGEDVEDIRRDRTAVSERYEPRRHWWW